MAPVFILITNTTFGRRLWPLILRAGDDDDVNDDKHVKATQEIEYKNSHIHFKHFSAFTLAVRV